MTERLLNALDNYIVALLDEHAVQGNDMSTWPSPAHKREARDDLARELNVYMQECRRK